MKNILALLLTLMSIGLLGAQNSPWNEEDYGNQCGTDQMIARNPFLQQLYAERVACAPEVDLDTAQVLTIPVVFHVIHLGEPVGEGTNISDEQILSCVENLNHRFRGDVEALAALTDEYDEYELSLVVDGKIEFCLAARDPNNEPTDGIMRYDGSDLSYTNNFSGQTSTAYYAEKGISNGTIYDIPLQGIPDDVIKDMYHWPVDKYFNCYIVTEINNNNAGNGVQGYSYVGSMGTGLTGYRYGPVCLYNVTGTVGTLKSSHNLNATFTHEVGHALNLFHTFGLSAAGCGSETNPCTQGDQVPDTPPTLANTGCSVDFAECPDAMLENYMDYTGQNCRTAFTHGQIERMREEIWTGLSYLVADDNVSCQSPNDIDVAISSVTLPDSWCRSTIDFSVKISNFGGENIFGAELLFDNVTYPIPPIDAGGYELISFTDYPLGNGVFEFEVIYPEDQYLENNTFTAIVNQLEENFVEVIISPDVWSNEIDWEITDENGNILLYGGNYPFGSDAIDFYESTCLPDGCYTFTITDSNGDGMCAFDFGNDGICDASYGAFINIISNGELIFDLSDPSEIDFGSELVLDLCLEYSCPLDGDLCPWDLNDDNRVSSADLMELLKIFNQEVGLCTPGDFNFDGIINQEDLNELTAHYGLICAEEVTQNKDLTTNENEGIYLIGGSPSYYNMLGQKVNLTGDLPPGIYIVVEKWSDGNVISNKIYLNSWQN